MLHILLLILKILGMLLLALLLLLVLVIALVMFIPVRYKGKGSYFEAVQVKATVSWLLHIVHFSVAYEGGDPKWKLRVFGIPIKSSENGKSSSDIASGDNKNKSKSKEMKGIVIAEDDELELEESENRTSVIDTMEEKDSRKKSIDEKGIEEISEEEKQSIWEKIKAAFLKIKQKIKDLLEKLRVIKDKVSAIIEKIRFFWNWWNLETTKLAVSHCKEELWILLKHIAPRKYNVDLRFGTGDPASTGQILGAIGIIYPVTKGQLRITPEFQEKLIEGKFDLKGRIFVYKLLAIAWRVFWDKNIRDAYESWNRKDGSVKVA